MTPDASENRAVTRVQTDRLKGAQARSEGANRCELPAPGPAAAIASLAFIGDIRGQRVCRQRRRGEKWSVVPRVGEL